MSVLSKQNNEENVIAKNADTSLNCGACSRAQEIITNHQELHSIPSPKQVRSRRILEVRQQLVEGTYEIDKRLNAVLDRLLEDLVA